MAEPTAEQSAHATDPVAVSLLHPGPTGSPDAAALDASSAHDLHLGGLFDRLARDQPWIRDWYLVPCRDPDVIAYRQAVARDLERPEVAGVLRAFAESIRRVRRRLEGLARVSQAHVADAWFLAAVHGYVAAVQRFDGELTALELGSDGMCAVQRTIRQLTRGDGFVALARDAAEVQSSLDEVIFTVRIQGSRVTVDHDRGEPDLSATVEETFAPLRTGPVAEPDQPPPDPGLDPVSARILELVAAQHPGPFAAAAELRRRHQPLLDPTVAGLEREIPFYLAYLTRLEPLRRAGLPLSYPTIVTADAPCHAEAAYDLAVGLGLVADGEEVVTNDWRLDPPERLLVVTGANQGGKTTFARAFGQLHHLAALGLPVPARRATVGVHDRLLTHFERQEEITSLHGKLEDELLRVHALLEEATGDSIVLLNETFSSTTLTDARDLGAAVLDDLADRGLRGVFVTFVDELATLGAATVSLVAGVAADDPTRRTFRVERRPPDGLAHALALAERYGLTYQALRDRIAP